MNDQAQSVVRYAAIAGLLGVVTGATGLFVQMIFLALGNRGDPTLIAASVGLMGTSITGLFALAGIIYSSRGRNGNGSSSNGGNGNKKNS
jgi:hypothetical protein